MASESWRDINDPGAFFKPEKEEKPKPHAAPEPVRQREPRAKEYKFKDVSIIEPAQGFERNKPFDIEGEIEPLVGNMSSSKILLYPIGLYNNQEDNFVPGGIEADLDISTNKFCGTCKSLFDPRPYTDDSQKPADATWKLFVRAEGAAAEKSMESEQLTFPKPSKFVILKKGDYDEDGAKKYDKPQSGDNFKPNGVVKALQGDLVNIGLLPKDSDDGFFDEQTDKAVRKLQDFAIKQERMKRNAGKVEKTDKTLDQQQPDGIVGKKTRDELDRWLQNDWIKPIPTLRHGEYDDAGVNNGKGKRGTEDHHLNTPIEDNQKNLQSVDVYANCTIDGWFFDKMKDAVKSFQEAAEKGEFIIKGVLTDIGEKLTGHQKGALCPKTQEYLKKVVDKSGKVPSTEIGNYKAFCDSVGKRESGNNYQAENSLGYLGKYQFGMSRLKDLTNLTELKKGIAKSEHNNDYQWTKGNSKEKFLNDSALQEEIFKKHAKDYVRQAKVKFSAKLGGTIKLSVPYFSKPANCQISEVKITISGIVGGAHLKGFGGVSKFINDDFDGVDANGTHISEYIHLFGGYDLKEAGE